MSQVPALPADLSALATNVGLFLAFIAALWAGIRKALKEIKGDPDPKTGEPKAADQAKLMGGIILDATSLTLWAESNRRVAETNEDVINSNNSMKLAIYALRDEIRENRHQAERLRDALERKAG